MQMTFQEFFNQLSETNATLDFFTNFSKVSANTEKIKVKLNQLNYLLGQNDLEKAVFTLYAENPKCFDVLNILIAIRDARKTKTFNNQGEIVLLNSYFSDPNLIIEFLNDTGLADLFRCGTLTNLVDYVFGIEVGLDTNARKNRSGDNMSKAISLIFEEANIPFSKEVYSSVFSELESFGADLKRFDFVVRTKKKIYLIETNFYNGGGSKLNEIARSYSELAVRINQYESFEFVWITDGKGWRQAKNKLEEAFNNIPSVYNLSTIENFLEKIKDEGVLSL